MDNSNWQRVVVPSTIPATRLLTGDPEQPIPYLIVNLDPTSVVLLDMDSGIAQGDTVNGIPLLPNQSVSVNGMTDVFAVCIVGTQATIGLIPGGSYFFQPPNQATFNNVQVNGSLGADIISANTMILNGQDVATLLAGALQGAQGMVNNSYTPNTTYLSTWPPVALSNVETALIELDQNLTMGRIYEIYVADAPVAFNGTPSTGRITLAIHYTTDGTTPTTASPVLRSNSSQGSVANNIFSAPPIRTFISPVGGSALYRFLLTGYANAASTWQFYQSVGITILDVGAVAPNNTNIGQHGVILGTGTGGGSGSVQTYTKSYPCITHRSYQGSGTVNGNGQFTWGNAIYDFQGFYPGMPDGAMVALLGFDNNTMQADLAGATITSCGFDARVDHSYYNAGLTSLIGTYKYTNNTVPGSNWTVVSNALPARLANRSNCAAGIWQHFDLGITIGNELKAGTTTGIMFGDPSSGNSLSFYGYWGSDQTSDVPYITVTYTK